MTSGFWSDKSVLVTGHTGFKGGWLTVWLSRLGATIHGYSLPPKSHPNLFTEASLEKHLASSTIGDIRDLSAVSEIIKSTRPEVIFHLAAQPLVRASYLDPAQTFTTNAIGTVNLLEAARDVSSVKAIVNITTDKCYENKGWDWPYRENDRLGGDDPYSASKACAEIIARCYQKSFLDENGIALANARAGNVIGGGDWAADRLVADFMRSLSDTAPIFIRYPNAVRPWQHVLEPLSGYLMLAEKLFKEGDSFSGAWNFGPDDFSCRSVAWVVSKLCEHVPGATWIQDFNTHPTESLLLKLDSSKAKSRLGWRPHWNIEDAIEYTMDWYNAWSNNEDVSVVMHRQIEFYEEHEPT